MNHDPRIGVASLVVNNGRLLLAPRDKSPDINSWQLPGGFLRNGESLFEAAVRLAEQKAGIIIQPLEQGPFTNNLFADQQIHTVTLYVLAEMKSSLNIADQFGAWQWFSPQQLPHPLFTPLRLLLEQHKNWLASVGIEL